MQLLASALPWQVTVSAAPVQQHNRTADERAFVVNSSAEALFFSLPYARVESLSALALTAVQKLKTFG